VDIVRLEPGFLDEDSHVGSLDVLRLSALDVDVASRVEFEAGSKAGALVGSPSRLSTVTWRLVRSSVNFASKLLSGGGLPTSLAEASALVWATP